METPSVSKHDIFKQKFGPIRTGMEYYLIRTWLDPYSQNPGPDVHAVTGMKEIGHCQMKSLADPDEENRRGCIKNSTMRSEAPGRTSREAKPRFDFVKPDRAER